MTGAIATPRYSTEDFETASIRSAAPSYVSEAPSYHSVAPYPEAVPPYSPPTNRSNVAGPPTSLLPPLRTSTSAPRPQTIGLPPVPSGPLRSTPNLNDFRVGAWSSVSMSPTAQRVAQRRVSAQRYPVDPMRRSNTLTNDPRDRSESPTRPLEDPHLVGEAAATQARQERLAREAPDDILVREDRQWDWFLAHMRELDERDRSWARFRRETEMSSRKKLLRRIGGRRLMM